MIELLASKDLSGGERAAVLDEPRNGVWWQPEWLRGGPCDRRPFTQEQTDRLIALELRSVYNDGPDGEMCRLTEPFAPAPIELVVSVNAPTSPSLPWVTAMTGIRRPLEKITLARTAHCQRGGVHSDPMLRLLAYRAWGERDRKWFTVIDSVTKIAELHRTSKEAVARQLQTMALALPIETDLRGTAGRERQIAISNADDIVGWFESQSGRYEGLQ